MDIRCHVFATVLFLWNPVSISANCPDPFVQAEELCLYVSSHRGPGLRTWAGARAHCQSIGGDLLTRPPDADKLKTALRKFTNNRRLHKGICSALLCRAVDRWMGASRDASADWKWESGSTTIPWRRPWPNQMASRPACLVIAPWDATYKDYDCDRRQAYLCAPRESSASSPAVSGFPNFGPPPTAGPSSSSGRNPAIINVPVVLPPGFATGSVRPGTVHTLPLTNATAVPCGRSTRSDERIANGRPTISGQYPWMVHLSFFSSFLDTIVPCGGALISRKWVLTAAHCFKHLKPNINVIVKIGFVDRTIQQPGSSVFAIKLNDIITHDEFNPTTLENDIALVRLPQDVTLSDVIQTICLGTNQHIPFGGKAFAAGWGLHNANDPEVPKVLHDVELDVLPDASCNKPHLFICTFTHRKDTCSGDSGGPLMVQHDNQWFQVGIVSFGPPDCGHHPSPGVYTRVPNYLPFISSNIRF